MENANKIDVSEQVSCYRSHMAALAEDFVRYLEQEAGFAVAPGPTLPARLPAYLRQTFELQPFKVEGERFIAVLLRGEARIKGARALVGHIQKALTLAGEGDAKYCLVAKELGSYMRRRLVGMRVPFVVVGQQIYWPWLGYLMTSQRPQRREPSPTEVLSPVTQMVLIAMLLGQVPTPASATAMARPLAYTPMSMSRAIRELEVNGLVQAEPQGRSRIVHLAESPRGIWERARPLLRNPVRDTVRVLEDDLTGLELPRAGESALAQRTMLGVPSEPTYAVASRAWRGAENRPQAIPMQDDGTCLVELWRYPPEVTARDGCVDPLSLGLSLQDYTDERVEQALEELMESLPW